MDNLATQEPLKILVADDEPRIRAIVAAILIKAGYAVEQAVDGADAVRRADSFHPALVIADLQMPAMNGLEAISLIRERRPLTTAIILTAHGSIPSAVEAIKKGASDYLTKPFDNEQLLFTVERALHVYRLQAELEQLHIQLGRGRGLNALLGSGETMRLLRQQLAQIAASDATVLIEGESGTGKELAARAIHYESKRRERPLVVIDCASIPANLIESEFFGHEKGAFTDARSGRIGKFQEADGGTLFLDELAELPLESQAKLLRVLQEKEFTRVGANQPVRVDVRVMAATNKNLQELTAGGRFRQDLYYRLNIVRVRMPSLREHIEDIAEYVDHFIKKYALSCNKQSRGIDEQALRLLAGCCWNGNIRELENAVQRALLFCQGERLGVIDFEFLEIPDAPKFNPGMNLENYIKEIIAAEEKRIILNALQQSRWNRNETAVKLGVSRKTLFNKMQQYDLGKSLSQNE